MLQRFQSQLQMNALPDEQLENQFEVIMPILKVDGKDISAVFWNSYQPIVESISFGNRKFKTEDTRIRTNHFNFASEIERYEQVNIKFFCEQNMLVQYYLSGWKSIVYDEKAQAYNSPQEYKRNIEIYFYGAGGLLPVAHYTLKGCFPIGQDDYNLSYSSDPKKLVIGAKFSIDTVTSHNDLEENAILAHMVTNPASTLANMALDKLGISGMFSSDSKAYDANSANY